MLITLDSCNTVLREPRPGKLTTGTVNNYPTGILGPSMVMIFMVEMENKHFGP